MLNKVHTLQKLELWRIRGKKKKRSLELHQDACHFYLGSFAGLLFVVMVSFHFLFHLISDFHTDILCLHSDNSLLFMMITNICTYCVQIQAWAKSMLLQVIALTEELLATAKQNQSSGIDFGTSDSASPSLPQTQRNENVNWHPHISLFFIFVFFFV